ncbi:MAG: 50S ribosomal protein L3 N(5)-glutamine methyltransferase [Betaproteobacteria bacterium]
MKTPADFAAAAEELEAVRDVLRFAVTTFNAAGLAFGHGFADARAEAAYLIAWALDLPHAGFDEYVDARLTRAEIRSVMALLRRRAEERMPSPYLTGEAWLGDYRFHVDERVLVPRSFIADLLFTQLSPWITDPASVRLALDLCTGSGCLAVLLAEAFPEAQVDGVDVSDAALEVAHRNVVDYALQDRVRLIQSDLMNALPEVRYDLIVSNPPYVVAAAMDDLPAEYRREPDLALRGGTDGLDLVRRIIAQAADRLSPGGLLVVEIGYNRAALEAAYPATPFTWLETHAGDDFVFLLTREDLPR